MTRPSYSVARRACRAARHALHAALKRAATSYYPAIESRDLRLGFEAAHAEYLRIERACQPVDFRVTASGMRRHRIAEKIGRMRQRAAQRARDAWIKGEIERLKAMPGFDRLSRWDQGYATGILIAWSGKSADRAAEQIGLGVEA